MIAFTLCLNNWKLICMQELYELPTAWLIYLHEHMVLSRLSVGSIRVYEPYSLSLFPMDFGPSAALQLCLGRHVYPTIKRMSSTS